MKNLFLLTLVLCAVSCADHEISTDDRSIISIEPTFFAIIEPSSRITTTSFDVGDKLGVYLTMQGQQIKPRGNVIDNALFVVGSNNTITSTPKIFYPDPTAQITLAAYYPYQKDLSDANNLAFAVNTDQTTPTNLATSDLCYSRQNNVEPTATPKAMLFAHKLSKSLFAITAPAGTTIATIKLTQAQTSITLDLETGTAATNITSKADITLSAANPQAITPAQTFQANAKILEITTNSGKTYYFTPQTNITISEGTVNTFNLTLNTDYTASLTQAQQIENWTGGTTSGTSIQDINNSFTAHWVLPHNDYATSSKATITIKNLLDNTSKEYEATNFKMTTNLPGKMCTYTFTFEPDQKNTLQRLTYPYQIENIKFKKADNTLVQDCKSIIAANIYKSGDYTLGIEQDNILKVLTGTISSWDDDPVSGGISGGGVTNDFEVKMVEPTFAYRTVTKLRLTIDNTVYEWGVTLAAGGNILLEKFDKVSFPATGTHKAPTLYPYTITAIDLLGATNTVMKSQPCYVEVGRGGVVTLQMVNGTVISSITSALGAWTSDSQADDVDYTGAVGSNLVSVSFSDGTQYLAKSVNKIILTTSAGFATLSGYTMAGTDLVARSTNAINITAATGSKPVNYPFTITGVQLYNGNTELISASLTNPLKISNSGNILLQVIR